MHYFLILQTNNLAVFKKILQKNLIISTFVRLRRLLPIKYKTQSLFISFLLLLNAILELVSLGALVPLILAVIKKNAFESGYMETIYLWSGLDSTQTFMLVLCIGILLFMILKNIISVRIQKHQARFAFSLYHHFSSKMQRYFYAKGFLYFKSENSNNIIRDINVASLYMGQLQVIPLLSILTEVIILLFVFTILFLKDPIIIVILGFLVGPVFIVFYRLVKNKITSIADDLFKLSAETYTNLCQSIFGYVDVMMNNKKTFFFNQYDENIKKIKEARTMQHVYSVMPAKVIETSMIFGVLLLVLYGVYFLEDDDSIELIALFALAAYKTMPSINKILLAVLNIKSYNYVLDIIEQSNNFKDPIVPNKTITFENSIELKNISFTYPKTTERVLKNINFEVKRGQSVGFIGRSGSGKTTLANLLLGFLQVNNGKILIDGEELTQKHLYNWRELVGYVQQDVFLVDGTLAENIALGYNDIDFERIKQVVKRASLSELVSGLSKGVDTEVGERGSKISGGQRQRVGIARALYSGAKILFFDEATSALDNETENEITEAINHLSDGDLTMFIIAHRHSTLKYCDFIVELKNGEMELLENKIS